MSIIQKGKIFLEIDTIKNVLKQKQLRNSKSNDK